MTAGIPLTDADRKPWLNALHEHMLQYHRSGESAILACSALKREYREILAGGFAKNEIQLVYLHAPAALIKERMKLRHHPYMNPGLLESQLATLQIPSGALSVNVAGSPREATEEILARLREAGLLTTGGEIAGRRNNVAER
jgi:gluconokinase